MKTILASRCCLFPWLVARCVRGGYRLDRSPHDPRDLVSLQSGARTYVNYCLGCHGAQFMRYKRLTELGLTEAQIRDNLLFTADKVGEHDEGGARRRRTARRGSASRRRTCR